MKAFEKKFGKTFLSQIPPSAGVYWFKNSNGQMIYVGKSKNLRRRLGQYKNAKRRKRDLKARAIVHDASTIEYLVCSTDGEACFLEMRLIQESRPIFNVAGAFYFLYPLIGVSWSSSSVSFVYTTCPERFEGQDWHGAFRSREITGEAFFSLMELFRYVGHRCPVARGSVPKYSYVFKFRQLSESWQEGMKRFLKGESWAFLSDLSLALVENAQARHRADEIQQRLRSLTRFWRHEAEPLRSARIATGRLDYPVSQKERDTLFIQYRSLRETALSNRSQLTRQV